MTIFKEIKHIKNLLNNEARNNIFYINTENNIISKINLKSNLNESDIIVNPNGSF